MRFSVVIPVYGTEAYLPRCLDSLAAQTCRDFEVVVVDDCSPGSPDGVGRIVADFGERFRCVRHDRNRSAFQARRTGVAAATGDYVVPVDPDDYLLPETLERLDGTVGRERPDLISYWIDYDDGRRIRPHWCRHAAATLSGADALRELTEHRYFTGVASKAFRRETLEAALRALDAPDDLYVNTCDDFLMLVPALVKSARVSFLDFAGYRYFVNEKSTSFSWKTADGFRRACEQTHRVGELVLDMAGREAAPELRAVVATAVSGIERWFVQMAADAPADRWPILSQILIETLSPENVAAELAVRTAALRAVRAGCLGRVLSRIARLLPRRGK